MKIVVGRDKLNEIQVLINFFAHPELYSSITLLLQGVYHKLVSFGALPKKLPTWQGKVVFFQVALHTTKFNEVAAGGVTYFVSQFRTFWRTNLWCFCTPRIVRLFSIWGC